jgi:ppGpp synthetase/RelA/SpoT-type nucleotidyltranferase
VSAKITHTKKELNHIKALVDHYVSQRSVVETLLNGLSNHILGSKSLMHHIHSTKGRLKDADHLEDKLLRKLREAKEKNKAFDITEANLLFKINDLAGFRILHLHTGQIVSIDKELRAVLAEHKYKLFEKPEAKTWDDESREFFAKCGLKSVKSPSMYTSVHYVVESNSRTKMTCEIQVRTLAEELWGEVDHTMNYPHKTEIESCREQIKVLARATSTCSRLVDSIFQAHERGTT